MEKGQKPIKIVFSKVVIQKCGKCKNGFLAKIAWHYLCQEKTIKRAVSAEIAQNQNWHLFREFFFDMGEEVGFANCVFEKLCSSQNTIFVVFSAKHSSCNKKAVRWKKQKILKNSGLFLNMAKRCFFFFRCLCYCGLLILCLVKLHKR